MTVREWIAFPIALLAWLCEDGGAWIADKLCGLSEWVAGPRSSPPQNDADTK